MTPKPPSSRSSLEELSDFVPRVPSKDLTYKRKTTVASRQTSSIKKRGVRVTLSPTPWNKDRDNETDQKDH